MKKILIIKLGALGDVVRTLAILPAIKEKYLQSEIYWVTKPNALPLFENNPYLKEAFAVPYSSKKNEKFDILYSFDTEEEASDIAKSVQANEKLGFYSEDGFGQVFNLEAEYYLNTMFDDYLKKTNKKTYQQMIFDAAKLEWKNQAPEIFLTQREIEYARIFADKNNLKTKKVVGIHMGAGPRWPSKAWHNDNLKKFITKAKAEGFEIILFGGPEEIRKQTEVIRELEKSGISVLQNNPRNSVREFAALVSLCDAMVCSDSFALHISLALRKPTVGLFFCTSPDEIEGYGLIKKLSSPKLYDFFPERMDEYDEDLVKGISADLVLTEIKKMVVK